MAEVARDTERSVWIDDYLIDLFQAWESIPAQAEEWDKWDDDSRLVFDLNWTMVEDRLHQLEDWAKEELLTTAQQRRFKELLRLVAKHRPTLERLLRE